MTPFGSSYATPGWQRAQARAASGNGGFSSAWAQADSMADESGWRGGSDRDSPYRTGFGSSTRGSRSGPGSRPNPLLIEGEILAKSTGAPSAYEVGARVLHLKFGPGTVGAIDGNKLTVDFDKAGRKMVLDSFVEGLR
jgi:DNA helicase-2/ATP-dependent DNA helicase PcrA